MKEKVACLIVLVLLLICLVGCQSSSNDVDISVDQLSSTGEVVKTYLHVSSYYSGTSYVHFDCDGKQYEFINTSINARIVKR